VSGARDPADREDVVWRLSELHEGADDEDRPRAALLLGLAIADLVGELPDGDPRRGELAAKGLACLAESADASAPAATATNVLRGCLSTVTGDASAGPESFPLIGAELNWDLDWGPLIRPAEAARNLTATLPFIASMLPPGDPLRRAFESITQVLAAFDENQWSPSRDAALSAAITQVEASGLGSGLGLMLRAVAMLVRGQRCQQVLQERGQPDWPSTGELDQLIAGLESADELGAGLGAPFQAAEGMHHLFIGSMVLLRVQVSVHGPGARQDAAWRDDLIRLLDRAGDHLRQVPPAYAGPIQATRDKLAEMTTALRQAPPPSAHEPATATSAPRAPSATRLNDANAGAQPAPTPPEATPAEYAAVDEDGQHRIFSPAIGQVSQRILDGLRLLMDGSEGSVPTGLAAGLLAVDAVNSRQWTTEHSGRLAELQHEAARLAAGGETPRDRAVVAAMLAMANAVRASQRSMSPQSAEHPSADDMAEVAAEIESALKLVTQAFDAAPNHTLEEMQGPLRALAAMQLVDLSKVDTQHRAELLARARAHFDELPAEMLEIPVISEMPVLERMIEGVIPLDDEAVSSVIDRNPNKWDQSGNDLNRAMRTVAQAGRSRTPADIGTALLELQAVWIGLPAGGPLRAQVLISMATMQLMLLTQEGGHPRPAAADVLGTAIAAVRASAQPDEVQAAARLLITMFALMLSREQREGPFQEAGESLRAALDRFSAAGWAMRLVVLTGIGAATAMRAAASGDQAMRAASGQVINEAAGLLPDPVPTAHWYNAARTMCAWAMADGHHLRNAESATLAVRLIGMLETLMSRHPGLAQGNGTPASAHAELDGLRQLRLLLEAREQPAREQRPGNPVTREKGGARPAPAVTEAWRVSRRRVAEAITALGLGPGAKSRRPLAAAGRPDPDSLRSIGADLHQVLADAVDPRLRQQAERLLGICHAELYCSGPGEASDQALREAVAHLNRSLMTGEHELPAVEWAETLDVLARCLREASRRENAPHALTAERVVRAALRELADCVMIAEAGAQAVDTAARANEIMARAIGWCLADDRPRAAVDLAETGRGLVLASVVLSGRAEEALRGAGRVGAAEAWRAASDTGRAAALSALRETTAGDALLSAPISEETSLRLLGTQLDAVVYLIPPAEPSLAGATVAGPDAGARAKRPGHAIVIRAALGQIEMVELPDLDGPGCRSPLGAYLAALDRALAADPGTRGQDGFRGGQEGQAWAAALDELGRWAHARIVGPLLDHVRGWSLDHLPHLALIPIGELAAIPYAAAWTDGPLAGDRRYAIEEAVLSYAASARMLGEVARRPRQPLSERVVLVSPPNGTLPMMRRATRLLASRQYPHAEVYGLESARDGPATCAALLGALPARDRPGASLLQLSTHGSLEPAPALEARDGWLALTRILDQARERAADAPGGLVITNACLTDTARAHYDESLTLATALLAAGGTAVVATRWPVDDDTTTILSLRLHYHLQSGCYPAEALRRAQLDLLRPAPSMRASLEPALADLSDARLSHPASWAGHVHHGI
jgi:hypothetical protein